MVRVVFAAVFASILGGCGNGTTSPGTQPPATVPPTPAPTVPAARLLVVTHTTGFRHDSIPAAETVLRQIGTESGLYETEFCRTADDVRARLTAPGLASIDAVFFANTTGNLGIPNMTEFLAWVAGGKAFLGAHSASDTYHDSPEYLAMLGGEFTTHGAIVDADVRVNDASNAVVSHLAPRFRIADEWYRFNLTGPGRSVLLSFDRIPSDGVGTAGDAADLPLAWQKTHGSGRVFYTAMGHRSEVWEDQRFRRHLLEAIRWALGR